MCTDRIAGGLEPACATMCPAGVLMWGAYAGIRGRDVARLAGFADAKNTVPHMLFIPGAFGAR